MRTPNGNTATARITPKATTQPRGYPITATNPSAFAVGQNSLRVSLIICNPTIEPIYLSQLPITTHDDAALTVGPVSSYVMKRSEWGDAVGWEWWALAEVTPRAVFFTEICRLLQ